MIFACCFARLSRENMSTAAQSTQFMVQTEEVSVLYLYTKFEEDSSIHAQLGIALFICMVHTQGRSVLLLRTKYKRDSLIRSKVKESQNLEIGSRDLSHAHLGSIYGSYAGGISTLYVYQI